MFWEIIMQSFLLGLHSCLCGRNLLTLTHLFLTALLSHIIYVAICCVQCMSIIFELTVEWKTGNLPHYKQHFQFQPFCDVTRAAALNKKVTTKRWMDVSICVRLTVFDCFLSSKINSCDPQAVHVAKIICFFVDRHDFNASNNPRNRYLDEYTSIIEWNSIN